MTTLTDHDEQGTGPEDRQAPAPAGRSLRRRTAAAAPAARFDPGRVAEPRHRNPTWLIAGILLVVLSALGGVLLFSSTDDRSEVLVAADDLEPGRPIERSDLRIERVAVDGGIASVDPADAAELIGRIPVGRVPAGAVLAPGMFADEVTLGADEMVVGAALDPGEAPLSGLQIGSPVELLALVPADAPATSDGAGPAAGEARAAVSLGTGTVWAVEPVATGQLWVSMRVDRGVGLAASQASAADTLRVVLVGAAG